tara:strand:+ start:1457 stop:2245 length:789 start_codon:yes stop_codon:yes gene_type:complete
MSDNAEKSVEEVEEFGVLEEASSDQAAETEKDTSSESASESEENHDKKQNGVQKRINDITAEKYKYKQEAEQAQKELEELRANTKVEPEALIAAPSPDLHYDNPEEFQKQSLAYQRQVADQSHQARLKAEQEAAERSRQAEEQAKIQSAFADKANKLGINPDEALNSVRVLNERGIDATVGEALVAHPNAPALFEYLATNPAVYDDLSTCSLFELGDKVKHIESEALKRNVSSTPEPTQVLTGLSAKEPDEFDKKCAGAEFI